jgi:hypothetical protein
MIAVVVAVLRDEVDRVFDDLGVEGTGLGRLQLRPDDVSTISLTEPVYWSRSERVNEGRLERGSVVEMDEAHVHETSTRPAWTGFHPSSDPFMPPG